MHPICFFEVAFFGVKRNDVIEVYLLVIANLHREALVEVCDSPGLADTIARGWLTDRRLLNPEGTIYGAKDS